MGQGPNISRSRFIRYRSSAGSPQSPYGTTKRSKAPAQNQSEPEEEVSTRPRAYMENESDDEEDNDEHGDEELHLILETGAYKRVAGLDNRRYRDLRGDKGEDYCCVGAILKARLSKEEPNTREFLIKWSGWSSKDNTWEGYWGTKNPKIAVCL